jgi:hypothetical protein
MITYSTRIKIAKEQYLSFRTNKKVYLSTKFSEAELKKYQYFLHKDKYETYSTGNFKLFVLLVLLENSFSSFVKFLEYLNTLTKNEQQKILSKKSDIITYKNQLKKDCETLNGLNITPELIIKMYNTDKLSVFYVYYFMFIKGYYDKIRSRIQKKKIQRVKIFTENFQPVLQYLKENDDICQ